MNIIENAWVELDYRVHRRQPKPSNVDALWAAIEEEWANLRQPYIDSLYDSVPNHVGRVLSAQGGVTKY
ncbi:hypothetical protein K435DRAFT_686045 [Dendrothele bispora CBS 962.96]|uniref:Uncharacterized protein n=1 Tax=Dendrothele bispora (strain CBS 962.96) TaxID=1314807 RepID=A0A4S8L8W4_DENBC|nr:hypothetical protein K435DRAFT_686045 [Dendrothele bispora CBS 962.96]